MTVLVKHGVYSRALFESTWKYTRSGKVSLSSSNPKLPNQPFGTRAEVPIFDEDRTIRIRQPTLTLVCLFGATAFRQEHLSAGNVNDLRDRKKPIVYIMLDDAQMSYKEFLEDAKERVGKKYYGQISLVRALVPSASPSELLCHP